MADIEPSIKAQSAKIFSATDWRLFKTMAELNLSEAARLQKKDMQIAKELKLLARNARKRLLIGVGVELLLKAVYLKNDFLINKLPKSSTLGFPFSTADAAGVRLAADNTYLLNDLINNLTKVIKLSDSALTLKGLKIAKVFRNKEGHVVTATHKFDPSNYEDIAVSLSALYRDAFGEQLYVRFSLSEKDKPMWQLTDVTE